MHEAFDEEQTDYTSTVQAHNLVLHVKLKDKDNTHSEVYLDNRRVTPAYINDSPDLDMEYYYLDWNNTNAEQHQIHVRVVDNAGIEEPNNYYVSMEHDESLAKLADIRWFVATGATSSNTKVLTATQGQFEQEFVFDPDEKQQCFMTALNTSYTTSVNKAKMLAFQIIPERDDDVYAVVNTPNVALRPDVNDSSIQYYTILQALSSVEYKPVTISVCHADGTGYNEYTINIYKLSTHKGDWLVNSDLLQGIRESFEEHEVVGNVSGIINQFIDTGDTLFNTSLGTTTPVLNYTGYETNCGISYCASAYGYDRFVINETWLTDDSPDIEVKPASRKALLVPMVNQDICTYSVANAYNIIYPRNKFINGWNTFGYKVLDVETGTIQYNYMLYIRRNSYDTRIYEYEYNNNIKNHCIDDYVINNDVYFRYVKAKSPNRGHIEFIKTWAHVCDANERQSIINCGWFNGDPTTLELRPFNKYGQRYPDHIDLTLNDTHQTSWESGAPIITEEKTNFTEVLSAQLTPIYDSVSPVRASNTYSYIWKNRLGLTWNNTSPIAYVGFGDSVNYCHRGYSYYHGFGYFEGSGGSTTRATQADFVQDDKYLSPDNWMEEYRFYVETRNSPTFRYNSNPYFIMNDTIVACDRWEFSIDDEIVETGNDMLSNFSKTIGWQDMEVGEHQVSLDIYKEQQPAGHKKFTWIFDKYPLSAIYGYRTGDSYEKVYNYYNEYQQTEYTSVGYKWLEKASSQKLRVECDDNFMELVDFTVDGTTYSPDQTFNNATGKPTNYYSDIVLHFRYKDGSDIEKYMHLITLNTSSHLTGGYNNGLCFYEYPNNSQYWIPNPTGWNNKRLISTAFDPEDFNEDHLKVACPVDDFRSGRYECIKPDGTVDRFGELMSVDIEGTDIILAGNDIMDFCRDYSNVGGVVKYYITHMVGSIEIEEPLIFYVAMDFDMGIPDVYHEYIFQDPECTKPWNTLNYKTNNNYPALITTAGFYTKDEDVWVEYAGLHWDVEPLDGYDGVYYVKPIEKMPSIGEYYKGSYPVFSIGWANNGAFTRVALTRPN